MDRFLIAPYDNGLQTDLKPFMIPDNAFERLDNAYVFRGRVRKRFGTRLMNESVDLAAQPLHSRLRIAVPGGIGVGTTNGLGIANGFVPNGVAPGMAVNIGAMFSVGDQVYTVYQAGAADLLMLSSAGDVARCNTTTGHYVFAGSVANTQVYFYPSLPVMGFAEYQVGRSIDNPTFAFDTDFAYQYTAGGWERLGTMAWNGNDHQFFWSTNWYGDIPSDTLLFTTNYNAVDGIKWYSTVGGWVSNTAVGWEFYTSKTGTIDYLKTARILLPFKDHLLAFNTIESIGGAETTFFNRVRWAQNGSPLARDATPEVIAWRDDIPGKGGWLDCSCKEPIITAQFLRDRLIVYFESSTWELVYTGNQIQPFIFQQINTELGAKATLSQVPFDKVVLGVGNLGIHACNGIQVERIDSAIPNEVFNINNSNNGPERVCGIRDYYTEMVYWSIPVPSYQVLSTYKYPNRVLVYNYRTSSWAFNDDSITAFGYYYAQPAQTWAVMGQTWGSCLDTWNSGELADLPKLIIAGNQEGFTFLIDIDHTRNAPSLQITNITNPGGVFTVINHNLQTNSYVLIENCTGITACNNSIYRVIVVNKDTFTLEDAPDLGANPYSGQGTITRISKIDILTKQFNFYLKQGYNTCINKVDFLVNREPTGPNDIDPQMYVECYPTYSQYPLVEEGAITGSLLGTSMLELTPYADVPLENWQEQLWHTLYFQNEGASVQFHITWTDDQMKILDCTLSDFQLNAMLLHTRPTASRLY